jgi:hypothetical protein
MFVLCWRAAASAVVVQSSVVEGPSTWSRDGVCCWRGLPVLLGQPLKAPAIESACVCALVRGAGQQPARVFRLRCAGNNCCRNHDVCVGTGGVNILGGPVGSLPPHFC